MGTGTTIVIGLLTTLIYDSMKYFLSFALVRDKKALEKRKNIEDFINTKNFTDYSELLESGIFQEYIQSPQVRDLIQDYFFYTYTRKKTKEIKEGDIYSYLTDNLLKRYDRQIKPKKTDVESFFRFAFLCIEEYFGEFLDEKDKYFLSSFHRAIERETVEIHEKFDSLALLIKNSMGRDVIEKKSDYNKIREAYMNTLQDKNKKAHIYLLDYFDLNKFYVPPFLRFRRNSHLSARYASPFRFSDSSFDRWKDIFFKSNIIYIIGGAGYGKSLFMKNIINNYNSLNLPDIQDHIVIYGELKKLVQLNKHRRASILEYLQDNMIAATGIDVQVLSKDFIQYYLDMGRCIILLDALDEVDKSERTDLHEMIIAFFENNNPHNKICITSRARGFIPISDIGSYFQIYPLEKIQIERYVDNIIKLNKFPTNDKESFMKQAEMLIQKKFLNSFLVLSLLINIYKAERELPENKLELYQKCFDYIATRREKEKMQSKDGQFDWNVIGLLMKENTFIELANLAFPNNMEVSKEEIKEHLIPIYKLKYGDEAKADNAIEEFLIFCSERTELFVPSSYEEKFKFFHRTFFEYFYSLFIFTRCGKTEEIYDKLKQFDVDSEVFELTIAMFKKSAEEKYQRIIEHIFNEIECQFNKNKNNYAALNMLILMLQVIDDVVYRNNFIKMIIIHKEKIFTYSDRIFNNDIIVRLILSNKEYVDSINEAYYMVSINEILLLLQNISKIYNDDDDDDDDDVMIKKEIIDEEGLQPLFLPKRELSQINHFYTTVFAQTNDLFKIFNEFKIGDANFPKKNQEKYIKAYNTYSSFSDDKRKKICDFISGNS